ncbi:MAG: hypothetical protein ACKVI4_17460, partial [Actinomycetales bacterium]
MASRVYHQESAARARPMSLRLLYGDVADTTRRRSRLSEVLAQGFVDHAEELEARLRTREVLTGESGLQGAPLLVREQATPRAERDQRRMWLICVSAALVLGTLVLSLVIAAAVGAFSGSSSPPSPPVAIAEPADLTVSMPPGTPPGTVVMYETQASTAFVAIDDFEFTENALVIARSEVAAIDGVSVDDVFVTPRLVSNGTATARRLSELDTSGCVVGAGQSLFALDVTVTVATSALFQAVLASILARLDGLTNPTHSAETATQCTDPLLGSNGPVLVHLPPPRAPPPSPPPRTPPPRTP